MVPPNADQDVVDDHPDRLVGGVDARNDLDCKGGMSDVTVEISGGCSSCVPFRGSLYDVRSRVV